MKTTFAALALGLAAPAAWAQPPTPPVPAPPVSPSEEAIDPARLAAAEHMVRMMMPPGTLRRLMADSFGNMNSLMGMDMAVFGGEGTGRSIADAASENDPHFGERTRISNDITAQAMGEIMGEIEPDYLQVLARYYARRFTVAELGEMTGFFTTPIGRKYVDVSFAMMTDPAFMQEMMTAMMRPMLESFPRIEERIRAATAHLPPAPQTETAGDDEDREDEPAD
jgi:hypothetical protein